MTDLCKLSRLLRTGRLLNKNIRNEMKYTRFFRTTVVEQPKRKSIWKISLFGAGVGILFGVGYSYDKIHQIKRNGPQEPIKMEIDVMKYRPSVPVSRKVVFPGDTSGLKLTLFQYQTCPFCCKVRVFLDYYGISYDVVEVDPVLRKEIDWSFYKKVPIVLTKVDKGYQPLNDSSMIVSLLGSYINDNEQEIDELAKYYPIISMTDENGRMKNDITNKYFLMFGNSLPKNRAMNDIVEERKWRKWADDVLVHTLSPNVYRTLGEAYQTFNWFSEVGKWEEYFPAWERAIMINVGACAMWLISKRLKKRHNLKDDVRQSLYDEVNTWLHAIRARGGQFMGGQNPDLSDLAVYGILKSIEGCSAFKDLLSNTNLHEWYDIMKENVDSHSGQAFLRH